MTHPPISVLILWGRWKEALWLPLPAPLMCHHGDVSVYEPASLTSDGWTDSPLGKSRSRMLEAVSESSLHVHYIAN